MAIAFQTYRGDTAPVQLNFVNSAGTAAYDLTGVSTLTITAAEDQNPTSEDEELWSVAMTITDVTGGEATFALSSTQADMEPGVYWFDVEATLAAGSTLRTIFKGQFKVIQDINK
jgi:hypothetical protein